MIEFIKNLLSSSEDVSSKRFAALITLISLIIMTFMAVFKSSNWLAPEFMFETLAWIVVAGLGLGVFEKFRRYSSKPNKGSNKDGDDSISEKEDIP